MNFCPQTINATAESSTYRKVPNVSSGEVPIFCCLKSFGDISNCYNCKEMENKTYPKKQRSNYTDPTPNCYIPYAEASIIAN
jgi:hypothetical protein